MHDGRMVTDDGITHKSKCNNPAMENKQWQFMLSNVMVVQWTWW